MSMTLHWGDDQQYEAEDRAALDAQLDVLDRAARHQHRPIAVTIWAGSRADGSDGPALTVTVGADHAAVQWTRPPGEALVSSNGTTTEEPWFEFDYGGDLSDLPAWTLIPATTARDAAHAFFQDQQRPAEISWSNI